MSKSEVSNKSTKRKQPTYTVVSDGSSSLGASSSSSIEPLFVYSEEMYPKNKYANLELRSNDGKSFFTNMWLIATKSDVLKSAIDLLKDDEPPVINMGYTAAVVYKWLGTIYRQPSESFDAIVQSDLHLTMPIYFKFNMAAELLTCYDLIKNMVTIDDKLIRVIFSGSHYQDLQKHVMKLYMHGKISRTSLQFIPSIDSCFIIKSYIMDIQEKLHTFRATKYSMDTKDLKRIMNFEW